jgi:hypothetical protein
VHGISLSSKILLTKILGKTVILAFFVKHLALLLSSHLVPLPALALFARGNSRLYPKSEASLAANPSGAGNSSINSSSSKEAA